MPKKTILPTTPRKSASKKPANDPLIQDWESMFVMAEHWKSDMDYFLEELNFFRKLVDKYFLSLIEEKHINNTRHLAAGLAEFDKKRVEIERDLNTNLTQLSNLTQNPFAQESQVSVELHHKLEGSMSDFVKNFKSLKKEVFMLAENVMESEKAKHLLGS
ncbi:MAG: hypothetical protein C0490_13900 [Marivirga sp.]|nr:hypothetical protein [Marivirga sp.]